MAMDPKENVPARLQRELDDAVKDFENPADSSLTADDQVDGEGDGLTPATQPSADALPDQDNADATLPADPTDPDPAAAPVDGGGQTDGTGGLNTDGAPNDPPKPAADSTWEQRYRVLDGKYRAELPRVQHRLQVALDENAQLKRRLEGNPPPATTPQAEADKLNAAEKIAKRDGIDPKQLYDLTEDELEYGSEVIRLAEKIAGKIVEERLGELESKQLNRQSSEGFFGELSQLVPDWREMNNDPEFKEFCDEAEPNSGMAWQEIIDKGQQVLDPVRIAHVFNTFRSKKTNGKPPASPAATTPVDAQVAPTSAPAPAQQGKKVYTVREWGQLMDNITLGRYTQKQAEKIKAELDAAFSEGRIKE